MKLFIRVVALTECLIGLTTLTALFVQYFFHPSKKSPGVFVFVLVSAAVSLFVGAGLFLAREKARQWLIYFSGYIVIEKVLIFLGVFSLNGKILKGAYGIPIDNLSFVYHCLILLILSRPQVRIFFKNDG